jgi:hypothetical protein
MERRTKRVQNNEADKLLDTNSDTSLTAKLLGGVNSE